MQQTISIALGSVVPVWHPSCVPFPDTRNQKREILKTYLRIFWLISLLFFAAGCSNYQSACYTISDDPSEIDDLIWDSCRLRQGEKVRITLVTGEKIVGKVARISSEWIMLDDGIEKEGTLLYTPSQVVSIEKGLSRSKESEIVENPEVGDEVSLILKDGSLVRGEVWTIDDETIVLNHKGESEQTLEYPLSQVQYIEKDTSESTSETAAYVVVGAVVFIGIGILAYNLSKLNNMYGQ